MISLISLISFLIENDPLPYSLHLIMMLCYVCHVFLPWLVGCPGTSHSIRESRNRGKKGDCYTTPRQHGPCHIGSDVRSDVMFINSGLMVDECTQCTGGGKVRRFPSLGHRAAGKVGGHRPVQIFRWPPTLPALEKCLLEIAPENVCWNTCPFLASNFCPSRQAN